MVYVYVNNFYDTVLNYNFEFKLLLFKKKLLYSCVCYIISNIFLLIYDTKSN